MPPCPGSWAPCQDMLRLPSDFQPCDSLTSSRAGPLPCWVLAQITLLNARVFMPQSSGSSPHGVSSHVPVYFTTDGPACGRQGLGTAGSIPTRAACVLSHQVSQLHGLSPSSLGTEEVGSALAPAPVVCSASRLGLLPPGACKASTQHPGHPGPLTHGLQGCQVPSRPIHSYPASLSGPLPGPSMPEPLGLTCPQSPGCQQGPGTNSF